MTVRDTYPVVVADGDQLDDGYFNGILASNNRGILPVYTNPYVNVVALDETTWLMQLQNGSVYKTTDSGATVTSKDAIASSAQGFGVNGANIIAVSSAGVRISSDSGDNWAAASTPPPNFTSATCVATNGANSVLFGEGNGDLSVWISADNGDTWATATVAPPTTKFCFGDMFDANHGILVDEDEKVWSCGTEDADDLGATWNDIGVSVNNSCGVSKVICISATTAFYVTTITSVHWIELIDVVGDTSTNVFKFNMEGYLAGAIKTNSGSYVFFFLPDAVDTTSVVPVMVYTTDTGVTWKVKPIGATTGHDRTQQSGVAEYANDKLLLATDSGVMKIDYQAE